ncbi:MAG: RNA polymerase sigma factor [Ardenticatenaceae bacterium]|nr:RNA polymerase sigma factor [Ardenticatenaceae bacterium]
MQKRTNEEWLRDLGSPDEPAFETAVADLRRILLKGLQRGLMRRVNTSALEFETLTEDFVQEALVKILDKLDTFAGRSLFTTWAHKITVSVALTELRRKRWQNRSLNELTHAEEGGDYTPSFVADESVLQPENATERSEMIARVNHLITNELTEKQRTAIVAAIIEGCSTQEVADKMDMKPNAVYKLLHDARTRLKKSLDQDGLTPAEIIAVFE